MGATDETRHDIEWNADCPDPLGAKPSRMTLRDKAIPKQTPQEHTQHRPPPLEGRA